MSEERSERRTATLTTTTTRTRCASCGATYVPTDLDGGICDDCDPGPGETQMTAPGRLPGHATP
jgi:uncharacterized OB-fold protein